MLRAASGIAFLAHPYSLKKPGLIDELLRDCDGLEALYARYNDEQQAALVALSHSAGKLLSAGSDYHGYFEGQYRNPRFRLPTETLQRLQA